MSRQKLTIIVTCTDRKSATPDDDLMVRNLPTGQVSARARVWRERLARATGTHARSSTCTAARPGLRSKRLARQADEARVRARRLRGIGRTRASARRSTPAPAYAATFSTWPRRLGRRASASGARRGGAHSPMPTSRLDGASDLGPVRGLRTRRSATQLLEDTARSDVLVFGGSKEIRDSVRVPSDRSLAARARRHGHQSQRSHRQSHGSSLSDGADPFTERARGTGGGLGRTRRRHREVFDRKPMSDSARARRSSESSACVNPQSPRRAR